MSLKIRRGTESDRASVTFDQGELVYTTDTYKLYIGDGISAGGKNVLANMAGTGLAYDQITQTLQVTGNGGGITSLSQDPNPTLGANLTLSSHNITGTGNISISGLLSVTGLGTNLSLNGYSLVGGGNINTTGTITATGLITGRSGLSDGEITINNSVVSCGINTFQIQGDGSPTFRIKTITQGTLGGSQNAFQAITAVRGSIATPVSTQPGDILAGVSFDAYVGSGNYANSGTIATQWDPSADLTDTFPKSSLALVTGAGGSVYNTITIDYRGSINAPIFHAGSFSTSAMNAIPSPAAGMIIFNSTTSHFYGYNGSAWIAFTGP